MATNTAETTPTVPLSEIIAELTRPAFDRDGKPVMHKPRGSDEEIQKERPIKVAEVLDYRVHEGLARVTVVTGDGQKFEGDVPGKCRARLAKALEAADQAAAGD